MNREWILDGVDKCRNEPLDMRKEETPLPSVAGKTVAAVSLGESYFGRIVIVRHMDGTVIHTTAGYLYDVVRHDRSGRVVLCFRSQMNVLGAPTWAIEVESETQVWLADKQEKAS